MNRKKFLSLALIILAFFTSSWFFTLPLFIKIISFLATLVIFFRPPFYKIISFILFLVLLIFQFSTTRIQSVYEFSGYENYLQGQRQADYPSKLSVLGNFIESTFESTLIIHLRQNFFDCFDWLDFFKHRFFFFFFLPFLFGLYKFLRHPDYFILSLTLLFITILTFIGPKGDYGPQILLPIIVSLIAYAAL